MRKKLSIIVPRYNETEEEVMPLLCSIRAQSGFDLDRLEVIIANDNPEDDFALMAFNPLNLDIKMTMYGGNFGPGVARQKGLEQASGEYVMFCDADDCLYSNNAIYSLLNEFRTYPETEILSSAWIEEALNTETNEMAFLTHGIENTWMHGKMFRTSFIEDNNLSFHPDLRVHEDSYFLSIAARMATHRRFLQNPCTYVWRWGADSITRRNNAMYLYDSFPVFIHAIGLANREIMRRKPGIDMDYEVAQHLIYCYFTLQGKEWFEDSKVKYQNDSVLTLSEEMKDFWDIWDKVPQEMIMRIYNEEREKNFKNQMERYTLDKFVDILKTGGQ